MIVDAIVKTVVLDKDHSRIELYSPKYKETKALAFLDTKMEGKTVKFITDWADISGKGRPISINGGQISDNLIGNTTLVMGMCVQCHGDDTLYVVMNPILLK